MFCDIAEAWASIAVADCASIWFLARSAASAAKSASSILDREASIFCWRIELVARGAPRPDTRFPVAWNTGTGQRVYEF